MKTTLTLRKSIYKLSLFAAVITCSITAKGQAPVPEMVFQNPVLVSGNAGADGAQYLFSKVVAGYDALVEVTGRSSALVVMTNIDTTGGLGYNKALQPVVGIPGNAPANTTWSMDFRLTFLKTQTSIPVNIQEFYATGLDIDGDGASLSEWARMKRISRLDTALVNSLTFTKTASFADGDDYLIDGIVANSPGIDTTATNVMATYKYTNKSSIDFTIGATTHGSGTTAGLRLNSIWFREFYNPPLPVTLYSFSAILDQGNVNLKWITATEIHVSRFVIEKSADGRSFHDAGTVSAKGNSVDLQYYSFTDNISLEKSPAVFYRLRIVDIDGKSEYSPVRLVQLNHQPGNTISILTYPNPVSSELRITIPANWQNKQVFYELFNANGQSSRKSVAANASQTESLNVSSLAPGFYIMRVTCEGASVQQKILKH